MKPNILLMTTLLAVGLAGCGGDDVEDAISLNNPQVRLAHISPIAPSVTLSRNSLAIPETSSVAFPIVTDYVDVDSGGADWDVSVAPGGPSVGTVQFDAQRGHRYTVVALADSTTTNSLVAINDPTNPNLLSDDARLRLFNGSFNVPALDGYLTEGGQDIAPVVPQMPNVEFKQTAPANGTDSLSQRSGTYFLTLTAAGSKNVLFSSQLNLSDNTDVIVMTVPDLTDPTRIRVLLKIEGMPGATELAPL